MSALFYAYGPGYEGSSDACTVSAAILTGGMGKTSKSDPMGPQRRQLFGWLWHTYLKKHYRILFIGFILMAMEGSVLGILAYMLQPMFDGVFIEGQTGLVWIVGAVIMGLFLTRAFTSVGHKVVMTTISRRSIADMQNDLMAHLMRLDMSFFANHPPGYLIERVQGDVQSVNQIWAAIVRGAGRDAVALVALMAVTISVDWRWTVAGLIGAPLLIAPALIAQRYTGKQAVKARDIAAFMSTRLDEVFHGISSIKLNALEPYNAKKYQDLTDRQVKVEVKTQFGSALIPALVDIMSGVGFVTVIVLGGFEIMNGTKTIGQFMSFFTAFGLALDPVRRLGSISGLLKAASVSIERMRNLLDEEPTLVAPAVPKAITGQGDIEFKDLSLHYGDLQVLNALNFTAKAGQTTALVGASGAGKSTVFHTLTRLVDAQSGKIAIGGTDIDQVEPADLRSAISVVSQETLLFDDTIRENILLGRDDVDEAKLTEVLKAAHVLEFVQKLPDGLDTPAGPRGSNLSGGQRQRIAIARALLRDTPILLLDEATSALDTQSEKLVQLALQDLSRGRTSLVIAHRLSTIQKADKIVVLDKGGVIEEGTHDELLRAKGVYADLSKAQASKERRGYFFAKLAGLAPKR